MMRNPEIRGHQVHEPNNEITQNPDMAIMRIQLPSLMPHGPNCGSSDHQ